jgi:hypothetical protein
MLCLKFETPVQDQVQMLNSKLQCGKFWVGHHVINESVRTMRVTPIYPGVPDSCSVWANCLDWGNGPDNISRNKP